MKKNCKYFIGYLDDDYKVKPLHLIYSKTSAYIKRYDGKIKWMYFWIEDDELLRKYNDIWNEVSNSTKKQFDREPFYNDKLVKIKIKYLTVMRLQIFTMKNYICLAVLSTDFILKKDENYYRQVFLKECKNIAKEKKVTYC